MKPQIFTALALCALTGVAPAASSVPEQINYQGQLLNNSGAPLTAGDHPIEIRIFDQPSAGTAIWGPQIFDGTNATGHSPQVAVDTNGRFSVKIGPTDTSGQNLSEVATNASLYVELKVGSNLPIFPRQQVLSTPFAFRAHKSLYASRADGLFTAGSISTTNLSVTNLTVAGKPMFISKYASANYGTSVSTLDINHSLSTSDYDVVVVGWSGNHPIRGVFVHPANPDFGRALFVSPTTGSGTFTMYFLGIRKGLAQVIP